MAKSTTNAREARNNPEVIRKLKALKADWDSLSKPGRKARIDELRALSCPWNDIAEAVGLSEAAIRYYKASSEPKKTASIEVVVAAEQGESIVPAPAKGGCGAKLKKKLTLKALEDELELPFEIPDRVVRSRSEKVKEACKGQLHALDQTDFFVLETLERVQERCDQWEYCGERPRPVTHEVLPGDVFARYSKNGEKLDPFVAIEHISTCLLRLLPEAFERNQLLSELRAEYSARR